MALARAQQATRDDKSVLGKMFGMFRPRPPIPVETGAASTADVETDSAEPAAGPVRGSTTGGSTGTSSGGNTGTGTFTIDPTKVEGKPQQAPKPR